MSYEVYRNFSPYEGVVTATTTISFNDKSRQIILMNDSSTKDLNFKFRSDGNYATLKVTDDDVFVTLVGYSL